MKGYSEVYTLTVNKLTDDRKAINENVSKRHSQHESISFKILLFGTITLVLLIVISWKFTQIYVSRLDIKQIIEPKHALIGLVIIYLSICLATNGYDLYSMLLHSKTNRPSGLYLEPSHLILYAAPLIFTVIYNEDTRLVGVILTIFIFVFAYTVVFMVLAWSIMLLFTLHFWFTRNRRSSNSLSLIAFAMASIFAISMHGNYLQGRLNLYQTIGNAKNAQNANLTTLVYLNGWLLAKATVIHTRGVGLGLGAMGCSEAINNDSKTLSAEVRAESKIDEIVCMRDGSFLASKIVSELGVFGIALLGFLTYKLFRMTALSFKSEFDLILVGTTCLAVLLLFARGLPYFSAPVVYCLISLIYFSKILALRR